jgi:hypothetical protein
MLLAARRTRAQDRKEAILLSTNFLGRKKLITINKRTILHMRVYTRVVSTGRYSYDGSSGII